MEDFQLDLIIGEGPAARSVRIDLAHFTLIGATTRTGLLTTPLRDRFGIPVRLEFYSEEELLEIVRRGAWVLRRRDERGRRPRDGPAVARHAPHRRPPVAPRARFRRRRRRAGDRPHRLPTGRCASSRSTSRGLDSWTTAISAASPSISVAVRSASTPSPHRCRRRAMPSRRSSSPISFSWASSTARRAAGLLTPHAFRHLGLAVPQRPDILQGRLSLGEDEP